MNEHVIDRVAPFPAGFLARATAWSLDALVVAAATAMLTWWTVAARAESLRLAWENLQQAVTARVADMLVHAGDPAALTTRLLGDPALRATAAAAESAVYGLLLPPLAVFAALAAAYWIGFERSAWQATPGKRALALRVTGLDGQRLNLARAATRHFAGTLSWLTLNLGHALAAVPPQKRALHDYVAGTRVVHGDGERDLPWWAKAWLALQLLVVFVPPLWLALRYAAALQGSLEI